MKAGLASVVARCRDRGYEPTFHHETGTYVEAPWEIQRILDISDVGLCLDTGHFFIGGGDPVRAIHEWSGRINHVHVKDALQSVMDGIIADNVPAMNIWSREAFPSFGNGDANVAGVIAALKEIDYEGWLVVEQDIFPQTSERFVQAIDDQKKNRRFLADHQV
jgi:inosose dehydratase